MLLRYDFASERFEALALAPVSLNGTLIDHRRGFLTVRALDQIEFPCNRCYMPHVFYIVLPRGGPADPTKPPSHDAAQANANGLTTSSAAAGGAGGATTVMTT